MSAAIETHSLTKHYRRTVALDRVTLAIPEGAVYALVGANGAGKTTLIRLLMNVFPPSAGSATVLGVHQAKCVVTSLSASPMSLRTKRCWTR